MTPEETIQILTYAASAINLKPNFICISGANCGDVKALEDYWWNPLESSSDCFEMNAELGIALEYNHFKGEVFATKGDEVQQHERYDQHLGSKVVAARVASTKVAVSFWRSFNV